MNFAFSEEQEFLRSEVRKLLDAQCDIKRVRELADTPEGYSQELWKWASVAELMDMVETRINSQLQRAGFVLEIDRGLDVGSHTLLVDSDSFTQVFINLVDNAIKFSAGAEKKLIELGCRSQQDGTVLQKRTTGSSLGGTDDLAKPASRAALATFRFDAPAPAVIVSPAAATVVKPSPRRTTTPATPLSRTNRLEPTPITVTAMSLGMAARKCAKSS